MKKLSIITFLTLSFINFSQDSIVKKTNTETIKKITDDMKGCSCVLLFFDPHFEKGKDKLAEEVKEFNDFEFRILDSIFFAEKKEIQTYCFYAMCRKYRDQITEAHFNALDKKQSIIICSGANTEVVKLDEMSQYLYKNSVKRLEKINNPEALKLRNEVEELMYDGIKSYNSIKEKLNLANFLEPNNPILLEVKARVIMDYELDVDSAFIYLNNSIKYSQDQISIERRYHNLGVCYMDIGDISNACKSWVKGGEDSKQYIVEHCKEKLDTVIHENIDDKLVLNLKLEKDTVSITHPHNPTYMESCNSSLLIKNISHPDIEIKDNLLTYGVEGTSVNLYLEAISENGEKFIFFNDEISTSTNENKNFNLKAGAQKDESIDITSLHHFPYAGKYRVRIVFQPSNGVKGLSNKYYSNWVDLVIIKKYQIFDEY